MIFEKGEEEKFTSRKGGGKQKSKISSFPK